MRLVHRTAPGIVELNWMWLPSFLAMNKTLLEQVERNVGERLVGRDLTDAVLDEAHELVLSEFVKAFPAFEGIWEYLDGVKYICLKEHGHETQEGQALPPTG